MRKRPRASTKLALTASVFLLLLAGFLGFLPLRTVAQGGTTITNVGPWVEQTDYGAASGNSGSGGIFGILGLSCVIYSSNIYCVGGQTNGTDISKVFYTQVSQNGVIGGWTETTDYGAASGSSGTGGVDIEWPSCVQSNGYIFCVGGATNSGEVSDVFYAQLSPSGVGPWTETTDFGAASGSSGTGGLAGFQHSCVVDSGYIYCVAGSGSKVFYSQLSPSGVGPWKETTDYGATSGDTGSGGMNISNMACVDNTGYIYCIGGVGSSFKPVSDTFYAPVNSSGVGPWTETTDFGATSGSTGSGGVPIFSTACVEYSSNIICVDGDTTGPTATNNVYFAKDQAIGLWELAQELDPEGTYNLTCEEYFGVYAYLFCEGGGTSAVYEGEIDTSSGTSTSSTSEVSTTSTTTTPVRVQPTLVTNVLNSSTITVGSSAYDSASLRGGNNPTGTITWTYYSNGNCGGSGTTFTDPVDRGNNFYFTPNVTPSAVGSYSFIATYSGDSNNLPATSACELLTVVAPTSSSSSSSSSTTSTTTTPTTPSEGGGIGSTDLLIGVGVVIVLLAAGGYLVLRRGKREAPPPPPKTPEAPPPPPRPPPPPPPPTVTPAPVVPTCPEGEVEHSENDCNTVTIFLASEAVPQIEGIYIMSPEEVEKILNALETAIEVADKATFAVGMVLDPVGTLITSIASPESAITGQFTGQTMKAIKGLADKLAKDRQYKGYMKVVYPKVSYKLICRTTTECIHGRWVVTKRELDMEEQGKPTMGEWVPQGVGEDLVTSQGEVNRLLATFRNSYAAPHNQQENAKVKECQKNCPAV